MLKRSEGGLEKGACDGGDSGYAGTSPLGHLLTDVGGLVGRQTNEAAQISGAGDNSEPNEVEVYLGTLDHRGFDHDDGFDCQHTMVVGM